MARSYGTRKRILVTGGAGFLGSHLIDRLLSDGHEVLCVDNLFTGTKRNIEHLHTNPRFEFMRHDVTFPLFVEVDEIYNLACPASPIHYQHDPVQTTKTSVHGAINMLGLAKRLKCRILQASTSEVYTPRFIHADQDYWGHVNPIGPRPVTTRANAALKPCSLITRQTGLQNQGALISTPTAGAHRADGRVVSNSIIQALAGARSRCTDDRQPKPLVLLCQRLIDGLVRLMESPPSFTGPVNLGNPLRFTVRSLLLNCVLKETGSSSKLVNMFAASGRLCRQRQPDISWRAKKTRMGAKVKWLTAPRTNSQTSF